MPAPHNEPGAHDDLEPEVDPLDEAMGPSWDGERQIMTYWFPDMQKAVFHGNLPDPRWELRWPDGTTRGWFPTYDKLVLYRQDRRALQKTTP